MHICNEVLYRTEFSDDLIRLGQVLGELSTMLMSYW
jgi:hypothetical protein